MGVKFGGADGEIRTVKSAVYKTPICIYLKIKHGLKFEIKFKPARVNSAKFNALANSGLKSSKRGKIP